jgi:hypothetical protein
MVFFVNFLSKTVNFCTYGKIGCFVTHVHKLTIFEKKTEITKLTDGDIDKDQSGTYFL